MHKFPRDAIEKSPDSDPRVHEWMLSDLWLCRCLLVSCFLLSSTWPWRLCYHNKEKAVQKIKAQSVRWLRFDWPVVSNKRNSSKVLLTICCAFLGYFPQVFHGVPLINNPLFSIYFWSPFIPFPQFPAPFTWLTFFLSRMSPFSHLCSISLPNSHSLSPWQVTPCSTALWLWRDVALWEKSRILRFSGSHRQTLYLWRMTPETRTGLLKCERSWTLDTSTLHGLPLGSAWTWVWMHIAGSLKTPQITASSGKSMTCCLVQGYMWVARLGSRAEWEGSWHNFTWGTCIS